MATVIIVHLRIHSRKVRDLIEKAIKRKGKILVPSFAIGRAQQLLYYMARAVHRGNFPEIPVYLDSPMAVEATRIYANHPELYDDEAKKWLDEALLKVTYPAST